MQVELAARILTRMASQTSPAEGPLFTLVKYSGLYFTWKNCLLFDSNRHKIIKKYCVDFRGDFNVALCSGHYDKAES